MDLVEVVLPANDVQSQKQATDLFSMVTVFNLWSRHIEILIKKSTMNLIEILSQIHE